MRLALGGGVGSLEPLVLTLSTGNFAKAEYVALGYTYYDVLCVGAAGGFGGGLWNPGTVPSDACQGGSPGGGGSHRVQGQLASLASLVPVVVGAAGADAANTNNVRSIAGLVVGGDGGASTFNTNTCKASGGKGGAVPIVAGSYFAGGLGGRGGIGNSSVAGGGGLGGTRDGSNNNFPGSDGTWTGIIGSGGGGGNGGYGFPTAGVASQHGSVGGRGSYNLNDSIFSGFAGAVGPMLINKFPDICGGPGGGAKATDFTGLNTVYGSRAEGCVPDGLVLVRLTPYSP